MSKPKNPLTEKLEAAATEAGVSPETLLHTLQAFQTHLTQIGKAADAQGLRPSDYLDTLFSSQTTLQKIVADSVTDAETFLQYLVDLDLSLQGYNTNAVDLIALIVDESRPIQWITTIGADLAKGIDSRAQAIQPNMTSEVFLQLLTDPETIVLTPDWLTSSQKVQFERLVQEREMAPETVIQKMVDTILLIDAGNTPSIAARALLQNMEEGRFADEHDAATHTTSVRRLVSMLEIRTQQWEAADAEAYSPENQ